MAKAQHLTLKLLFIEVAVKPYSRGMLQGRSTPDLG